MSSYTLKIVTPDGMGFEGEVTSLIVKTIDGEVGILAGHTDYFAATQMCACRITLPDNKSFRALCGGGFLRVGGNLATLVTEVFERDSDIDRDEASRALELAKQKLAESKDERENFILKKSLTRATIRSEISAHD